MRAINAIDGVRKSCIAQCTVLQIAGWTKNKTQKVNHELLIDWVRSSQIWKKKKLALGRDTHFEKVNNKGSGFKT